MKGYSVNTFRKARMSKDAFSAELILTKRRFQQRPE
jgi:hypothetical protein